MPDPNDLASTSTVVTTVLCVEDQPISMDSAEALLSVYPSVRLLKAYNGQDGIRLARAERPALILLDMQLPDMTGLDVVRALSELLSERTTRVVLLTSDSFSIEVVKAMSLGAQEYWPKPLTPERVEEGLHRVMGIRKPDAW